MDEVKEVKEKKSKYYYTAMDAEKIVIKEIRSWESWGYSRPFVNSIKSSFNKIKIDPETIEIYYSDDDSIDLNKVTLYSKPHITSQINTFLTFTRYVVNDVIIDHKAWKEVKKIFNKIKKTSVNPYVINFYNKLSHNAANYSDGGPIKDLYDSIMDDFVDTPEFNKFMNKYVKLVKFSPIWNEIKFKIDMVKVTKDEIYNTIHIEDGKNDTKSLVSIVDIDESYSKIVKKLRKYQYVVLYNFLIGEISLLLQDYIFKLKEMKFIDKDCRAFFSRLATITYENSRIYSQALSKLPDNDAEYVYNKFDVLGRKIVWFFSKSKYAHIKKTDMDSFRKEFAKKFSTESYFTTLFTDFVAVKSLYDQYHRDLHYYETDAIDNKVRIDNQYDKAVSLFSYNLNWLIDVVSSFALKEMNKIIKDDLFEDKTSKRDPYYKNTTYEFQFISAYFRVIRTFLKESGTRRTDKILQNNTFDIKTFENGIAHDFMNTKSVIRLYKRFGYSDEQIEKVSKDFAFHITKPLINLTVYFNDFNSSFLYNFDRVYVTMQRLSRDFDNIKFDYTSTNTKEIFLSCYSIRSGQAFSPSIRWRSSRFVNL